MRSISSSAIQSVLIARFNTDVKAMSNWNPSFASSSPAVRASRSPFSVSPTSVQPVKRFSWFQTDSP